MAAYAALVSLLNTINQIKNHHRLSTSLDNNQIQPLLEKISFLLDFMEGNNYVGGSKEATDLEKQIASAAHTAEDVIESHIVDRIHAGTSDSVSLQQNIQDMDVIAKKAAEVKKRRRSEEEEQPVSPARPLVDHAASAMVGLDAELNHLLDELTGYQSNRRIISIVGMGGTGKTTLAKNVYENLLTREQFQFCAWATISQRNNPQQVLSELLSGLEELSNGKVDELGKLLHRTLLSRKYLIVLDDIWDVIDWDEVKRFFPDSKNGSRILLTTRLSNVAKDCSSSLFEMNLLDEKNSWKLFRAKAFHNGHCPHELLEVEKEIVKSCKGLALTIVVIGGLLLKSPRTVRYWKEVAQDLKPFSNSKEKQESLEVLSLSYNHLPPRLKPCFLYMGTFKEDSQIRVSRITKVWVAEGFIKPIESRDLEEIAKGYVHDLIDRNLILVGRRSKNGKVGSCKIHDLLKDLCIKLAEQEEFFHVTKGKIRGTERRLVDDRFIEGKGVRLPLTRSIMTRGYTTQPVKYRLLRVFDEAYRKSEADYYENVNLRYLAYNHRYDANPLWKIPASISLIWNLQTLIIEKGFQPLQVAPTEFWKMRQLRHVHCCRIYIPSPPPSDEQEGSSMLENLQTLKTVVNLRLCKEVCRIISNVKKLNLVYARYSQGYDDGLVECVRNLNLLRKLESLNLNSSILREDREAKKELVASFPSSLKKLSLTHCRLHWDDMSFIGSLPQLEVLKLEAFSFYEGGQWSLVDEQFRRLRFLKIDCCDLVCWDADESHFPVLENLHLHNMYGLEEIPLSIGDIPTLELIRMDNCRASAAVSAVRIKEDQLDNGGQLQVQIRVPTARLESFNQMLITEGLTIDNILFFQEYQEKKKENYL